MNPPKRHSSFAQEFSMPVVLDYPPLEIEEDECCPSTTWRAKTEGYFSSLSENELEYMPNPYAIDTLQPEISYNMRVVLFDWMIEICSEFSLKRETCYLAINYMDRALSNIPKIKKNEFQLFGIACMVIASKCEEIYPPRLDDWVKSADNGYSPKQILNTEKILLNSLNFKIYPATVYNWINWLMSQWDNFVDYHFGCVSFNRPKDFANLSDPEKTSAQKSYEKRFIVFKEANQKAYKRFRETLQILDASSLRVDFTKFIPRVLAGGLLYLMVSKYFFETNYELLYYNGPERDEKTAKKDNLNFLFGEGEFDDDEEMSENQHIEGATVVQELYSGFLAAALGIKNIEEIYPAVTFFHPFLEMEIVFDLPVVCKVQSKSKIERHYEEFLNYQTHNPCNVRFINQMV
jgi:cyclin E